MRGTYAPSSLSSVSITSLSSSLVYLTRSWTTSAGSARLLSPEPPVPLAALALPFVVAPLTSPFLPLACVSCRTSSSTFRIRTGNVVASPLRRSSTPRCSRAVGQFDGSEWSLCSNRSWILCRGEAWLAPVHEKPSVNHLQRFGSRTALTSRCSLRGSGSCRPRCALRSRAWPRSTGLPRREPWLSSEEAATWRASVAGPAIPSSVPQMCYSDAPRGQLGRRGEAAKIIRSTKSSSVPPSLGRW